MNGKYFKTVCNVDDLKFSHEDGEEVVLEELFE